MNSTQMILLSNNGYGRVFFLCNLYKSSCILSKHISHVLTLGFINAFKHSREDQSAVVYYKWNFEEVCKSDKGAWNLSP